MNSEIFRVFRVGCSRVILLGLKRFIVCQLSLSISRYRKAVITIYIFYSSILLCSVDIDYEVYAVESRLLLLSYCNPEAAVSTVRNVSART